MPLTAIQQNGEEFGAGFTRYCTGEYRGATTAARFSDPQAEFEAMRSGCGVYDLGFRAKLSLTGGDRVRWLNGMVTNNIRDLSPGHGVYAFLLNPQGHILADLYAYNRGESGAPGSILVDTDVCQVEKVLATFDHYIIMDDVEVANLSDKMTALGVAGPKALSTLRAAGIQIPEMRPLDAVDVECTCDCECVKCTVVRGEGATHESYELWLGPGEVRKTWDALLAAGAAPVGFEALELRRIASGIPLFGVDIRERDLPQETGQDRALNFSKGCYIGQEIVERIRSRGAVHRIFTGFVAEDATVIAPGAKIIVADKEAGEITSTASWHFGHAEKTIALGYIRREMAVPGREVMIGATKAKVVELPLHEEKLRSAENAAVLERA